MEKVYKITETELKTIISIVKNNVNEDVTDRLIYSDVIEFLEEECSGSND